MTRTLRFLSAATNTSSTAMMVEAPPPEAVTLESDFVVILAALLCALICVVGLIAVARCAWLRRGAAAGGRGTRSPSQAAANKGLKKKVLQSLPKFTYGAATADVGGGEPAKMATECAICLGDFAEGEEIRVLPQCGHSFHVGCIDTWLGSHSSCPSCRQILVVGRCQKCGQFPAVAGGSAAARSEAQLKARQDIYHSATVSNHTSIGFLP